MHYLVIYIIFNIYYLAFILPYYYTYNIINFVSVKLEFVMDLFASLFFSYYYFD